ncbi:carbohydrate kinase [Arthrobacter sp. UCD-GKA]|uniref:carbohydrate kinase family protein n=1 Tax=Arthrobacter sp. UCD-GKA TaxID=1913576 RepID=UPI0008DDB98E|nr:carbohydrate kinase [Arthrobacter sp. UCD-GKA]OIH85277.1 carbohydrate kinase [Arthrobacter sp. UCD-GKA]
MNHNFLEHQEFHHDVLVIGEALIDVIASVAGASEHPGGSPANVAYGLGKLGIPTALLTSIGSDARGAAIERHLAGAGVVVLPESLRFGPTGTAQATLSPDGSARYTFDIHWDIPEWVPEFRPRLVHTGSIAAFLSPGADVVKSMLERFAGDCVVTFDPNIRPALLGSHTHTLAAFEELVPLADVVKLSDEDAEWLYPGEEPQRVAGNIIGLGAKLAIVTFGGQGSYLATSEVKLAVPPQVTAVADTVGAGDSYMAALIYGILAHPDEAWSKDDLFRLAHRASIAASITVGRAGANPPTEAEVLSHPGCGNLVNIRSGMGPTVE